MPGPPVSLEALAAQRMAVLQELGEMGMELARALKAQALAVLDPDGAEVPKVTEADPVLMFTRVARAVRQTLALQLRCARSDQDAEAEGWRAEALHGRQRRKDEIAQVVRTIIEDHGPDYRDRLSQALEVRLEAEAPDDEDFTYLSTGVMVARICRELGVEPCWDLWMDTPWAHAEAMAQTPGSPFVGPGAPAMFDELPPTHPGRPKPFDTSQFGPA